MPVTDHRWSGWILAGGLSKRLGQDKALLPFEGQPLVLRTVNLVRQVTGNATIVGRAAVFKQIGIAAMDDHRQAEGPLAGIITALEVTESEWNLFCPCDLPRLDVRLLEHIRER
ncbi:MAG TPA: molybdenum cofactor guanylyltransferase, partial [Bryobacteraceae bacterium]|nr:molybdenum cofactor guanylyltransferase [Bryobacteraceae bacterium]